MHREDVHPRLRVSRQHVAHLTSLPLTLLNHAHDERGNCLGHALLVQLVVVDRVRRLHRAQTEVVHVEVVLRVDEAYGERAREAATGRGGEGQNDLRVVVMERVVLVATEHGGEVSPRGVTHGDFSVFVHAHEGRALEVLGILIITLFPPNGPCDRRVCRCPAESPYRRRHCACTCCGRTPSDQRPPPCCIFGSTPSVSLTPASSPPAASS